ncbi:MAG TPA: Gfo/Idh/MocA family oxidoreductase [Propionibacteriaceae bacterium]
MAASDRGSGGGQVLLSLGVVVSRLVQVGVLGTSYWVADFHLLALRSHAGARVRAICGRDRRRAQALAEQHDVPEVYTDYRAMIDSSELDALVVVMPEDLHHPIVIAGVEAGLHVVCEKPMAFTADRSGGNAGGGRAGAGEAHGAVHQSRAAALPLDQASARGRLHRYAVPRLLHAADGLVSGTAAEFVLLVG